MNMKSVLYFYKGITVPQEGTLVGLLVDGVVQPKSAQFDWDRCNVTAVQVWGPANDFWKLWRGRAEGNRKLHRTDQAIQFLNLAQSFILSSLFYS